MPAPAIRTDVAAFIAKLRDNPTKGEEITREEIDDLQARLSPSTLKTYLSWRRTAVLEALGAAHPAYDMLRLTDEQYRDLNAKYQAAVSMRQSNPIRLRHTREMVELAVKMITGRPITTDAAAGAAGDEEQLDGDDGAGAELPAGGRAPALMGNVRNLILGLCLLTGRRAYEIAANPETRFQPIYRLTAKGKVREKFQLEFRGQAKTKGAEQSMAHKLNTIPVLADAGLILDAFERLREMIPGTLGMDYDTFNRSYAKPLGRRCKQLFGPYWPNAAAVLDERTGTAARGKPKVATPEISVKDLRTVYGEICSIVFNLTGTVDEKMKPSEYLARILGHRETDLATAQSYSAIVIEDITAPGSHPRATKPVDHGAGPAPSPTAAPAADPTNPAMRSKGKADADLVETGAAGRPDIKGLPNAVAGAARRIEASHDPVELFVSLALLTGLPPRDLVDPEVTFQHRTTRAGAGTVRDKTAILASGPEGEIAISVLAGTDLVLDAIARLRAAIAKGTLTDPEEIDAQWRPELDRHAKGRFSKIAPSLDQLRAAHDTYLGLPADQKISHAAGDAQQQPDSGTSAAQTARESGTAAAAPPAASSRKKAADQVARPGAAPAPVADAKVVDAAREKSPPKAKPQTFRQLLDAIDPAALRAEILAQGRTVNIADKVKRFRFNNLILVIQMFGTGNYLAVEFNARADKPQTIANIQRGRTLTEAEALDLVTAWADLGRKTLPVKKVDAILVAAATGRKAASHTAKSPARAAPAASTPTRDPEHAALLKNLRQQEKAEDQLLALAADLQVDQLGDGGAQLAVHGGGPGKDQLVIEFDAMPGRPWPIANLPKGTPLTEAAARAIATAWVEGDRIFLDDVTHLLDAGRPAKAPQKPASSRKANQQGNDAAAGTSPQADAAPPVDQLIASLRPEHLDRSARLEQHGSNLVVVFDERPADPVIIAKLPAGTTLSDTQIGDLFDAWSNAGRKPLTTAATKNAIEQG